MSASRTKIGFGNVGLGRPGNKRLAAGRGDNPAEGEPRDGRVGQGKTGLVLGKAVRTDRHLPGGDESSFTNLQIGRETLSAKKAAEESPFGDHVRDRCLRPHL